MNKIFLVFALILSISCTQKKTNPLIEVYNDEINSVIDVYAQLEILADKRINRFTS